MFEYIIEFKDAIENRDLFWLVVLYCIGAACVALKWDYLRLPKYSLKFVIFNIFSIFMIILWTFDLLTGPILFITVVLLIALAAIFIHSSRGNLLWPCSAIHHDATNHLRANEPENAEQMLNRYKWCFIDSTEKYSYRLQQAAIAAAKNDVRRSIDILSTIDKNTLNTDEKIRLDLQQARYFSQLGDYKKAKQIVERYSSLPNDYLIQINLIRALSTEVEGKIKESSDVLLEAITWGSDRPKDGNYQCLLNNIGRIRKIEMNYTDSLYYYRRSLELAKDLGDKPSMHITYQNVIFSLILLHKLDEVRPLTQEYRSIVDFTNPYDIMEFYNFLIEYYRQTNDRRKLSETLDEGRERIYPIISRKEQIIYDISLLRMRWNGEVLSPAFLSQIEFQYSEYSSLSTVEKFNCYMEIHHILEALDKTGRLIPYEDLFIQNRENIRHMIPDLEKYLLTIPEYCVFERCRIMWDIVRAKKCGNVDYDKDEVLQMLQDIKNIHLKYGNIIEALNTGLDISDEALGQKQYAIMWTFTQLAIEELQKIRGHPAEIPAFIQIGCYAYNAGEFDVAREYVDRFEATGVQISNYSDWIQNYYKGLKIELKNTGESGVSE